MAENTNEQITNIEPVNPRLGLKRFKRDADGLLEGLVYIFTEDGRVDWKRMVPKEYLYVNNDSFHKDRIEKKYGKNLKEIDPIADNVEDRDLVITLGGLKYLLTLRGYYTLETRVDAASESYAAATCRIHFIPNFEEEGIGHSHSDSASAHFQSTTSFAKAYLVEMATNRAIARCIRSYLRLSIVSREELGADGEMKIDNSSVSNGSPHVILENKCNEKNYSFAAVKKRAIEAYKEELASDPSKWTKWSDIDPKDCFVLLNKIKSKS